MQVGRRFAGVEIVNPARLTPEQGERVVKALEVASVKTDSEFETGALSAEKSDAPIVDPARRIIGEDRQQRL